MPTTESSNNRTLGPKFFLEQDRLRGGPAPELCHPEYRAWIGANPPLDRAGHERFAVAFYAGFPDMKHTIEQVIAEPDSVAVRFSLAGTHTADFMGIPASGKKVQIGAMAMLALREGQVIELHSQFDQVSLMRQIGAL